MIIEQNRHIALEDGVRLTADVYRPAGDAAVPALVGFSVFGKEVQAMARSRPPLLLGQCLDDLSVEIFGIDFFVRHGYAVALVNPRGISTSGGSWEGLYSERDQLDCCAAIQWVAAQPFCTGKVGMLGMGSAGRIQPLVAARHPKGLAAIMPVDLIDDLYQECYPGGILSNYYLPFSSTIPLVDGISEAEKEYPPWLLAQEQRRRLSCPEVRSDPYLVRTLETSPPRHFPFLVDVLLHDQPGRFWENRGLRGKYQNIRVPMYAVTPLYEFGRSVQAAVEAFTDPSCPAPRKLWLMGHATQRRLPLEEADEEMLRWYDHWLKGEENGIMDEEPVRLQMTGDGRTRMEKAWPPPGMELTRLYLSGGGVLSFEAGDGEPDALLHEPPIFKSQFSGQIPALRYTSPELEEALELTGPVSIRLYAAIDQPDGNFHAKLWDVLPDGRRMLLATGCVRAACRRLKADCAPGQPETHTDVRRMVEPGKVYDYTFALNPVCNVFERGHKIQLEIKATDPQSYSFTDAITIPRLFSSGHTGGATPSVLKTNYQIHHSGQFLSHLLIPLVKKSEGRWLDQPPEGGRP